MNKSKLLRRFVLCTNTHYRKSDPCPGHIALALIILIHIYGFYLLVPLTFYLNAFTGC